MYLGLEGPCCLVLVHDLCIRYTCIYTCMLVCTYTYAHTYMTVHMHVNIYIHLHMHLHTYIYICTFYIYLWIYIYIYIYTHVHIHIHIQAHISVCMCIYIYIHIRLHPLGQRACEGLTSTLFAAGQTDRVWETHRQKRPECPGSFGEGSYIDSHRLQYKPSRDATV